MNLTGIEDLARTGVVIAAIVLIILMIFAIAKGKLGQFLGIFACALLAAGAVMAVINYERVGPAVLALIGL